MFLRLLVVLSFAWAGCADTEIPMMDAVDASVQRDASPWPDASSIFQDAAPLRDATVFVDAFSSPDAFVGVDAAAPGADGGGVGICETNDDCEMGKCCFITLCVEGLPLPDGSCLPDF